MGRNITDSQVWLATSIISVLPLAIQTPPVECVEGVLFWGPNTEPQEVLDVLGYKWSRQIRFFSLDPRIG